MIEISLVIAGAIVFFAGVVIGFIFAAYGSFHFLKTNGYIIKNGKIIKPVAPEEIDRWFRVRIGALDK